jgi:16S rRNA (adenine1518-N6/adenine1519-N6)-dimethyltransferase
MNKNEIISVLKELGKRPNKALGQNFLVDKNILDKIVNSADIKKGDRVLEIGPGLGVLSQALIKLGADLTAIEKDKHFAARLESESITKLVSGDASKTDLDELMGQKPWKFVSNLPYSITSIALRKALYAKNPPSLLIALIQKEVAERILAEDKKEKMSLLSLMSHLASSEIKIIHRVSPTAFYPEPKVDSAIIKIVPLSQAERLKKWGIDPEQVMKVAKLGFAHPRKLLGRNLGIKTDDWAKITSKLDINPKARSQELKAKDWVELAKYINSDL